jgi:hypothetical protein
MNDEDPLRPARGVVTGVLLGTLFWLALAAVVVLIAGCGSADDDEPQRTCFRCQAGQGFVLQTSFTCSQSQWQGQDGRSCYARYPGVTIRAQ